MSDHYTDGPRDQPWEFAAQTSGGILHRHDRVARWFADNCDSNEFHVWIDTDVPHSGDWLAARLNRLDTAERELTALREGLGVCDPHTPEELNAIAFGHRYSEADAIRQRDAAQARNDTLAAALERLCAAVEKQEYYVCGDVECDGCRTTRQCVAALTAAREVLNGER